MRTPLNTAVAFLREHRVIRDEMIRSISVDSESVKLMLEFDTEAFLANFGSTNFPGATVTKTDRFNRVPLWRATFMWRKRRFDLLMSLSESYPDSLTLAPGTSARV
jgi:hypothetical protein